MAHRRADRAGGEAETKVIAVDRRQIARASAEPDADRGSRHETLSRPAVFQNPRLRKPELWHEPNERMLPIVLLQEWPVEHVPRMAKAENAARAHVVPAIPIPGEVVRIDPNLLRLRRGHDLHCLVVLHRVAARERPVAP